MGYYTMRGSDFYDFMRVYLDKFKIKGLRWEIEISTTRNKKADYHDPSHQNKYTMYIFDKDRMIMKSAEQYGSNKANWTAEEYAKFLITLEDVI